MTLLKIRSFLKSLELSKNGLKRKTKSVERSPYPSWTFPYTIYRSLTRGNTSLLQIYITWWQAHNKKYGVLTVQNESVEEIDSVTTHVN